MGPITAWAAGSTLSLVVMTGLYLDKRDDYAAQVDACNSQKLAAIAEAEQITRKAVEAATARKLIELERQAESAHRAREIAEEAKRQAEARPVRVREVIKEVAANDPESCLNVDIPDSVRNSLRND